MGLKAFIFRLLLGRGQKFEELPIIPVEAVKAIISERPNPNFTEPKFGFGLVRFGKNTELYRT